MIQKMSTAVARMYFRRIERQKAASPTSAAFVFWPGGAPITVEPYFFEPTAEASSTGVIGILLAVLQSRS
jgi:hypothetical protein